MYDLTVPEIIILVLAVVIVLRGLIDHGMTTTEAGLVLGLLGLIPVNRLDRRRR